MFGSLDDRVRKLETGPSLAYATGYDALQQAQAVQVNLQGVQQAADLANAQATTAIQLAGTKNTVFYSGTAPTANAVNDQWINTAQGNKLYIWNGTSWISVQDNAIQSAQAAAASAQSAAVAAQTTADGKNKIYRQGTTPTGSFAVGDLWFDTSSDNAMSRWDGSSWVSTTLGTNALANFSANKITSGTIDASVVNVSNINAGNISTGTLASARIAAASITGSQIAANTITASNITSGTITASQIASGTITSTQIATGTITATNIASSTITGGNIAANTITAGNIAANTITASQIAASTITATQINSLNGATIGGWDISSTQISISSIGNYISSAGVAVFSQVSTNSNQLNSFAGPVATKL